MSGDRQGEKVWIAYGREQKREWRRWTLHLVPSNQAGWVCSFLVLSSSHSIIIIRPARQQQLTWTSRTSSVFVGSTSMSMTTYSNPSAIQFEHHNGNPTGWMGASTDTLANFFVIKMTTRVEQKQKQANHTEVIDPSRITRTNPICFTLSWSPLP